MLERISRELLKDGIEEGIITFGAPDGDDTLAAYIGDYWFYIAEQSSEEDYSHDELADLVYDAVNDGPINAEDDDEATECLYYKYYLEEQLGV